MVEPASPTAGSDIRGDYALNRRRLLRGPVHDDGIAQRIQNASDDGLGEG